MLRAERLGVTLELLDSRLTREKDNIRKMNSSDPYLDILLNKELIAISQVRTLTCATYHRELLEEMDGIYARHVPP